MNQSQLQKELYKQRVQEMQDITNLLSNMVFNIKLHKKYNDVANYERSITSIKSHIARLAVLADKL